MTVSEFYARIRGDCADAMARLTKEERILKYVGRFVSGAGLGELDRALQEQRWADAFREAHSLKGVALNLGFRVLADSSGALCEALRSGEAPGDVSALYDAVARDYADTVAAAKELLG